MVLFITVGLLITLLQDFTLLERLFVGAQLRLLPLAFALRMFGVLHGDVVKVHLAANLRLVHWHFDLLGLGLLFVQRLVVKVCLFAPLLLGWLLALLLAVLLDFQVVDGSLLGFLY